MLTIDFSTNANGKLFCDVFSDIRLYNDSFEPCTECEIILRGQLMGIAKIESANKFHFYALNNGASIINCGKPAPYQKKLLTNFYNRGLPINPDTIFQNIVFRWIERNGSVQNVLIKEWWENQTCKVV